MSGYDPAAPEAAVLRDDGSIDEPALAAFLDYLRERLRVEFPTLTDGQVDAAVLRSEEIIRFPGARDRSDAVH